MCSVKRVKWHLRLAVLVAFTSGAMFVWALHVQCCALNWACHGTSASYCATVEIDGGMWCIPIVHTTLLWQTT